MKNIFQILVFFLVPAAVWAQVDYSNNWEDFYSYNNVKDFIKTEDQLHAIVDNAVFTFNSTTGEMSKISSVNGLSGESTSSIFYSTTYKKLIIGYETGLIEIIDNKNTITILKDIVNFNFSGNKQINNITEYNGKLYLSTSFAIVVYDLEKLEFGDTFFIGHNSSSLRINETTIVNNSIFAATEEGIFSADITNNLLIDFNNWTQQFAGRNFSHIVQFNNQIFVTEGSKLFQLNGTNLIEIRDFFQPILGIKTNNSRFQ